MIKNKISKYITPYACILILASLIGGCKSDSKTILVGKESLDAKLIFSEDFESGLGNWKVEQMPRGNVSIADSKLEIDDTAGCTIWLKEKFNGSIVIEYDVMIIEEGGENDRVSDLNCFWMANDPTSPNDLFANSDKRGGKFSNYDGLKLYYMGVGGNDNKTTRFRRYTGTGERPILPEHDLAAAEFMLEPNKPYHIKIIAHGGVIQYYRDDVLFVDYIDKAPYPSGYFGFRTVNNHMTVDNFEVHQLEQKLK